MHPQNLKGVDFFKRSLILVAIFFLTGLFIATTGEAKKNAPEKILYIPHDNRPVVNEQTVEIAEKCGYQIIVPPKEILGSRENLGDPDKLWEWLKNNAKRDVRAAVISSDSMIYGSLVGSRKHDYDKEIILQRAEQFRNFHKDHKNLAIYVFGSIMRTPRSGDASGQEEPDYYRSYGANIFRYTALRDKKDSASLTPREVKELDFLQKLIPERAISDWMGRREKNFAANEKLIDLTKEKDFDCLLLGRDDNAPYSQTHFESRQLQKYGNRINRTKYQTIAGIDEVGLMLITRAINDRTKNSPQIFVEYNTGSGADTVPSYSDEPIDDSINAEILAVGAKRVNNPRKADFVLAVNTNPDGKTYEAARAINKISRREGTEFFADVVQKHIRAGHPVAVADIAFANGADNAMLEELKNRGLLLSLHAYAGWNTATNSTGFALSTGILAKKFSSEDKQKILMTRYVDDWAYQANVRNQLQRINHKNFYGDLNENIYAASDQCASMISSFVENKFSISVAEENLRVEFPWNRLFESRITVKNPGGK